MMMRNAKKSLLWAFLVVLGACLPPSSALSWEQNYQGIWLKQSSKLGGFTWSGIQLLPQHADINLVRVEDLVDSSDIVEKGLIKNSDGTFSTPSYSLREVWKVVQGDPSIVAAVPIGYLQGNGSVAGYMEIGNRKVGRIFIAPNLTSIYCIQSKEFLRHAGFTDLNRQVPYLFPLQGGGAYREGSLDETLILDRADKALQKRFFESCTDQIQVGPRLIEPRKIGESTGLQGRFSEEISTNDARGQFPRTVISWAYSGYLSIVTTSRPVKLKPIAGLLSSDSFYVSTSRCSAARELDDRSLSCEYWATAATSFEHSGMILRLNNGKVTATGDIDSKIGAALIIRSKFK